jgi:tetratricopeptide (TPR) repeat protein
VLGYTFDAAEIESLGDLPQTDLVDALEELERHALLRIDAERREDRYTFTHDVVRESVYGELSRPRKRLMHRKVARLLQAGQTEPATAYEVARHASLAGEAELGVEACIAAAQYALRTCANADAEALARRGLHHVAELDETTRVAASLELLHVLYSAKTPDHDEAAERVRNLAERALDLGLTRPARIGFQMLSYLRWESSSMAAAHANILQAERVSRSADPDERSQALAHAARCLVLLERNLGQAEAFVMEAKGVTDRSGRSSAAVAFAVAMIAAHRGEYEVADASFAEAQQLARLGGERLAEFGSMEHRLMLALDRDEHTLAKTLAGELVELGTRVRPGAEVAIARALCALTRFVNFGGDETELAQTVEDLRTADAKYELSFVLTRWAAHTLERGDLEAASALAQDGVEVARAIGRASEIAVATAIRADICRRRGETDAAESELGTLEGTMESDLSATARRWLQRARPQ